LLQYGQKVFLISGGRESTPETNRAGFRAVDSTIVQVYHVYIQYPSQKKCLEITYSGMVDAVAIITSKILGIISKIETMRLLQSNNKFKNGLSTDPPAPVSVEKKY
jgi:hypothetical protein